MDNNDDIYFSYIKEPMLIDHNYLKNEYEKLEKFLLNIFDKDINDAKRRSVSHFSIQEKRYYLLSDKLVKIAKPLLRLKSKIKNKLVH